jgi:predicted glycosyltransferase involved in capsule biosynthesis
MSQYSIVITTFDERFNECLVPLIKALKSQNNEVEIIVMVNGRAHQDFDEEYRSELLRFLSDHKNCFPSIMTSFQSLSKLWNRGILTASHDQVLVLNDDITALSNEEGNFLKELDHVMKTQQGTFKINGSFSHFMIDKKELMQIGFFDERLLGIGEEDGDFVWRYYQQFQREIPSIPFKYIDNTGSDLSDDGYQKGIRQYSQFNRDFIKREKYQKTLIGGYKGMFDNRVKKVLPDEKQYPYEEFYRTYKSKL